MLTQAELKEKLFYDQTTGVFTWIKQTSHRTVGSTAGHIAKDGRIRIRFKGESYLLHRLAWLYVYGRFPKETIDHIDRNHCNNKLENLREASFSENSCNRGLPKKNTSGAKGVTWCPVRKKWYVRAKKNRKNHFGGYFENFDNAKNSASELRKKLHQEFTNHGM